MNCYDVLKEEFVNYWIDEIDNNFPNYQLVSPTMQKCGDSQIYDLWVHYDSEIVSRQALKTYIQTYSSFVFKDCIEEESFDNLETVFDEHVPLTLQHFADELEFGLLDATKVSIFGKYELKYDSDQIYTFVANFIEKYFPKEKLIGMPLRDVIKAMDIEIVEKKRY